MTDAARDVPDIDLAPTGEQHLDRAFMDSLRASLADDNQSELEGYLTDLQVEDLADVFEILSVYERKTLARAIGERVDPELLSALEGEAFDQFVDTLDSEQIAEAVGELEIDDAVEVLEEMDDAVREEVLEALDDEDRAPLERSLGYPEDSAGRLMQTGVVALPQFWTVGQTIDYLRSDDGDIPSDFYDIIVVDPVHKPIGTIAVSRLMRAGRPTILADLMAADPMVIDVMSDQEEVAYQFTKYHLISASVVDETGRLLGIITVDDVVDVIDEEAEEDILALAGVGESSLGESFNETVKARLIWLSANLATAILASLIIGMFDYAIDQLVALAILMPIVASMGGNAGTQTMTVTVRALATRELSSVNAGRVLGREIMMALLNGLVLGAASGVAAYLWFGNLTLGLIFGAAMVFNMLTAALSGVLLPLGLSRAGIDPAVASSVFVTTITDVVGFFVFLGGASWLFL